jgi:hypothetical protein
MMGPPATYVMARLVRATCPSSVRRRVARTNRAMTLKRRLEFVPRMYDSHDAESGDDGEGTG